MPRLPVDGKKVIEHRISFGTKERQMIDRVVGSYQFNRIATPTVDLMKDATGMAVFAGIIAIAFPKIYNYLNIEGYDPVEAIKNGIEEEVNDVLNVEDPAVREKRASSLVGGLLNVIDTAVAVFSGRLPSIAARTRGGPSE